jgi:hypothetical protein
MSITREPAYNPRTGKDRVRVTCTDCRSTAYFDPGEVDGGIEWHEKHCPVRAVSGSDSAGGSEDDVVHFQRRFRQTQCGAEFDPFGVTIRRSNVTCFDCLNDLASEDEDR